MNTTVTPKECPQLTALADACVNGACNVGAILISLADAILEVPFLERSRHVAIKYVLGHCSYLMGQALGPSAEVVAEYTEWRQTGKDRHIKVGGRDCILRPMANGATELLCADGGELTEAEWEAYCAQARGWTVNGEVVKV